MAEHEIFFEIKDLVVKFGRPGRAFPVVKGVNLSLERGKVLGLVGESGCGKSVTMLSSMGLLPQNNCEVSGSILFDGQDLMKVAPKDFQKIRGKRISMVFQEPMTSLNPVFTIGNQLEEMLAQHEGLKGKANKDKCLELLSLVSIPDPESVYDYYPFKLSGGMRQRVMIAMALACDPELLIADEPTTALDVTTQAQIIELFKDLQHKLHTSIVFISHDLGVIGEISDHIAVLYAGYVMEECGVKTLFQNPLHPYTFGLMSSRMGRTLKNKDKLYSIPGIVPSAENMPAGCPFAPRCARAGERCANAVPPLREVEPGHKVRCWEVAGHE
jgi:oligopeptide/dipeptide ABC transporter, ATP-binding protein, C-terminal domain